MHFINLNDIDAQPMHFVNRLQCESPDLVWILLPGNVTSLPAFSKAQTAARVILHQQLQAGRHVCVEGITSQPNSQGFYVPESMFEQFPRLLQSPVWWCSLGIARQNQAQSKDSSCNYRSTATTFSLPSRFLSCCGRYSRKRGIKPKRTPTVHYLLFVKLLRECFVTVNADPILVFPTETLEKPEKRKRGVGLKTLTEADGPGEHADVVPPKHSKEIENCFDDCGDDLTAILESADIESIATSTMYAEGELSNCCPSDEENFEDSLIASAFDSEFLAWSLPGSDCNEETDRLREKPFANHVSDMASVLSVFNAAPGLHDIVEIFGGEEGKCTQIAIRRKLKAGPNLDIVCGCDLTNPKQEALLWKYILEHKPSIVIAGPPCTSFGPWSHYNRVHHFDTWAANRKIGMHLARIISEVCQFQLTHHRHFLIENPLSSELWKLEAFQRLLSLPQVVFTRCDQCMMGLVDPTGVPTLKPTGFMASHQLLVKRLHVLCDRSHEHQKLEGQVNGVSRCRFAQAWPYKLCEKIIAGTIDVLSMGSSYPASASVDPYGGEAAPICKGCKAHAARHDPRHTRIAGTCKFPLDIEVKWDCPACIRFLPSTNTRHAMDETCQWSQTLSRRRGYEKVPAVLREPRAPPPPPNIAPDSAKEPNMPPPVNHTAWKPLKNVELLTTLDSIKDRDGWHQISSNNIANTMTSGRHLRTCEPRFELTSYPFRSVHGFFPEHNHEHGMWWTLQVDINLAIASNAHWSHMPIGFTVPILVLEFRRSASTEKKTRDVRPSQIPVIDAEPAEPPEHDVEELPPPVIEPAQEPGDADAPYQQPEWSSFDLGRCLRALRSEDQALQARALKRLHVRWWHCTTGRMQNLLKSAGVSKTAVDQIPSVVNSCKVCRAWQRPSNRSVTASRLAISFNESVQFDLLFCEDSIIGVLIDESTRWTCADIVPNKEVASILRFVTDRWIRIFGAMQGLVSDQEGALVSEEAAVWLERHGIQPRSKAKNAHAYIAERHHSILRDMIHKILGQARSENLAFEISDVLSEAVFCKNIFVNIGGYSPFQAVFGRLPHILADLDTANVSAMDDSKGGIPGISRHAIRLREIAVSSIVQATAQSRMQIAERTKTRLSAEHLDLRSGDLIDVFRDPSRKDLSGWRGPATVINVDEGTVNLKWGNRTMTARIQDTRRHVLLVYFLDYGSPPIHLLRSHLLQMTHSIEVFSWVIAEKGWQLSRSAKEAPDVFEAVLHVAANQLKVRRCLGARLGRGLHTLSRLYGVTTCFLIWWPADRPALYHIHQHDAREVIQLKHLVPEDVATDICWIQFLTTDIPNARKLRDLDPDTPQLADDPDDPDFARPGMPRQTQTNTTMHSPVDSMSTRPDDADMPQPPPSWPRHPPTDHIRIPVPDTRSSQRSRSTIRQDRTATNTDSTLPVPSTPSATTSNLRRPVPSNASSSHRPTKLASREGKDSTPSKSNQQGGSSSSQANPSGYMPASNNAPLLPTLDSDDDSLPSTIAEPISDLGAEDFFNYTAAELGDGGEPWQVYTNAEGEVVEKALGELTPADIKQHWPDVAEAVRKELKSFSELGVFKISVLGTTGNVMTSRWVLRWKLDAMTKQHLIKARLTVRGFLDKEADWLETFASTASRWGQKLIVAVAVQNHWKLLTADVGAAFLRGLTFTELARLTGTPIRRCAFKPPTGYADFIRELPNCQHFDETKHELEMIKPVYGLKDAPRAWRKRLHLAMGEMHAVALRTDTCLYVWRNASGGLAAICSAHVDDIKLAGEEQVVTYILRQLTKWFGELKVSRGSFEHCGILHDLQSNGSYHLHQNHFAQRLKNVDLTGVSVKMTTQLLNEEQLQRYMSSLGSVAWLVQTRTDVAIYIQALQRATKQATVSHLLRLSCVIKWCRRKPTHLTFVHLRTPTLKVLIISDAAFRREDVSGLAMRGAIISIGENHRDHPGGLSNVIEYYSRRQRRVVRSTFGAETNGAADAVEIGRMIAYTMAEITTPNCTAAILTRLDETGQLPLRMQLIVDCRSLYDALKMDETQVPREASLIMLLLQLKESLRTGSLESIVWCDTRDMVADGLNKGIIARKDLINYSTSANWILQHPFQTFREKRKVPVSSAQDDALASG